MNRIRVGKINCGEYLKMGIRMMNRRDFLKTLYVGAASINCTAGYAAKTAKTRKPNIVLIFIDDMGYGDIGPFGSKRNKTPNLDRMAAEGIKLTNFYVSSTACTPSRSALMTGCYADRIGMDGRVNFPGGQRGLNPKEVTVTKLLKAEGYATGCFGKWHLGDQPEFMPLASGFDEYVGIPYSNDMWPYHSKIRNMPALPFVKANKVVAHVSNGADQALLCKVFTDEAVSFIKRHRDEPFFAYLPHSFIHTPRFALKADIDKADGDVVRAQIETVDRSVGKILRTVRELGLTDDTLVFFTSDNGGSGGTSMGPLRGGKGGPKYEGHMRVPTVAWWPGRIPAASVSDEIGATIDILPTLARLAGTKVPTDRVIDGKDISDLLFAKPGAKSPHDVLYYEYEGVRRGKWKLVKLPNGNLELYDLEADIGEQNDLSGKHPEQVTELKYLLDKHTSEVQANRRKAAFVEEAKPLLESTEGVPTLAKYLGLSNVQFSNGK